jgi:Sec-independent protein translocase protein TatA
MGTLFGSPRKVLVVAAVLVVAIVLVALFGSKKLPDNVPAGRPGQV